MRKSLTTKTTAAIMAAATLVGAQADAMKAAASNSAGAMTGFMGLGFAQNAADCTLCCPIQTLRSGS